MVVQCFYHIPELIDIFLAAVFICTGEKVCMNIFYRNPCPVQQSGEIGDEPVLVIRAAVGHILPYQHSHTVAVEIPAVSLDLAMFAEHIEAKGFHGTDVMDQCFVRGAV